MEKTNNNARLFLIGAALLCVGAIFSYLSSSPAFGSVQVGQEYKLTELVDATAGTSTLKLAPGSVGSIVVMNTSSAAKLYLFDTATTTVATTSLTQLLEFDPAAAEGTYQFDVEFTQGLMMEVGSSFDGSIAITYR